MKPLFRWAGGKRRLVTTLEKLLPGDMRTRIYNEPFAGSAALALHLGATGNHGAPMYLSDANWQITNVLRQICREPMRISTLLRESELMYALNGEATFKANIKAMEEPTTHEWERAAAFICVQQMSFNGLWRVNSKGKYNVPFGKRKTVNLPTRHQLMAACDALRFVVIEGVDADRQLRLATVYSDIYRHCFWYIDPPYVAANGEHTRYTSADFRPQDHRDMVSRLAEMARNGSNKIMISAANTEASRAIYSGLGEGWYVTVINATRSIAANGDKRGAMTELVYTNYKPGE